jgi:hypothetical protein
LGKHRGKHASTATPPPAHITSYALWDNESATQATDWLNYGEGTSASLTSNCTGNCHSILYLDASDIGVTNTGGSSDAPYGGECGSSGPGSWKNTATTEDWYEHAYGTDKTNAANRVAAEYNSTTYRWFANKGSANFRSYIASYIADCVLAGYGGVAVDNYYGLFLDNMNLGLNNGQQTGMYATLSQFHGNALNLANSGTMAWGGCANLYDGTTCTTNTEISGNESQLAEYSTDCTPSGNTCAAGSYLGDIVGFINGLKHKNGSQMYSFYNGQLDTDTRVLYGTVGVTQGAVTEEQVVNSDTIRSSSSISNVLDIASYGYHDGFGYVIEDSGTDSGSCGAGSNCQQQLLRLHAGVVWLSLYGRLIDWPNFDGSNTAGELAGVYPYEFVYPTNPVQTMTLGSGGSGGAASLCVSGTYPNCLYRREFTDCYIQTNFNTTASGADGGHCGVLLNLTGSSVTLDSTTGPAWLQYYSLYTRLIAFCTPSTGNGYFTPGCNPATSGGDVTEGALNTTGYTFPTDAHTIPSDDAVFFIAHG